MRPQRPRWVDPPRVITANLTTLIVVPDTATVALAGGGANNNASNMTIEFRTDGSGML